MSGYKVGDQFIVEITEVSDTGMGVVYYLNDMLAIDGKKLGMLEPYVTPVEETSTKAAKKRTHTPEELRNKIFALSGLLAKTIETYQQVTSEIDGAGSAIDRALEECGNG